MERTAASAWWAHELYADNCRQNVILFLSFASLASRPDTDLEVFATALGAGILLDATVARALPRSLVALFGRWNSWLPRPLARVLRVPRGTLAIPKGET